jgi:hypothetical protein
MTGEPAPDTPQPENCNDKYMDIEATDLWAEIKKLNEHTLEFFKGFW